MSGRFSTYGSKPVRTKYQSDTSFALVCVWVEIRAKSCISGMQIKFDLAGRGVGAKEVSGRVGGRRVRVLGGKGRKTGENAVSGCKERVFV
jgi:hypothetical protein